MSFQQICSDLCRCCSKCSALTIHIYERSVTSLQKLSVGQQLASRLFGTLWPATQIYSLATMSKMAVLRTGVIAAGAARGVVSPVFGQSQAALEPVQEPAQEHAQRPRKVQAFCKWPRPVACRFAARRAPWGCGGACQGQTLIQFLSEFASVGGQAS